MALNITNYKYIRPPKEIIPNYIVIQNPKKQWRLSVAFFYIRATISGV